MKAKLITLKMALIFSVFVQAQTSTNEADLYYWPEHKSHSRLDMLLLPAPDSIMSASSAKSLALSHPIEKYVPLRPYYNHSMKLGVGYHLNTARVDNSMRQFNDTSEHHFNVVRHTPTFTFTHHLNIDTTFGVGYSFGFSSSEIYYNDIAYGSKFFFIGVHPILYALRTYNFEYYFKFNVGVWYEQNNLDQVHSEVIRRTYPTGFHMFTGFTFAGLNFLINDHFAINTEFSLWSQESVNIGLTYRFLTLREKSPDFNLKFAY